MKKPMIYRVNNMGMSCVNQDTNSFGYGYADRCVVCRYLGESGGR